MKIAGYDGGCWTCAGEPLPRDCVPHPAVCAYFNDPALREDDPLRALLQDAMPPALDVMHAHCVWVDGPGVIYGDACAS